MFENLTEAHNNSVFFSRVSRLLMFRFGVDANKLAKIDGRLIETCNAFRHKGCNPETAAVLMFITLIDSLTGDSSGSSEIYKFLNLNSTESLTAVTEWAQAGLIPHQLTGIAITAIERIPLLISAFAPSDGHNIAKLEVEPNQEALTELVQELVSTPFLLEQLKAIASHDLKVGILSVLYHVADEKVGMIAGTPFRLTSLSYTFGPSDTILGDEFRMQVMPLISNVSAKIYRLLLVEPLGPNANEVMPTLNALMHNLFEQHRTRLVVGSKRTFWGDIKHDHQEFPIPIVSGIDRVIGDAEDHLVLKEIFGT